MRVLVSFGAQGWFWIDAPSSWPLEPLDLLPQTENSPNLAGLRLLRMFRLLRLLRLLKVRHAPPGPETHARALKGACARAVVRGAAFARRSSAPRVQCHSPP